MKKIILLTFLLLVAACSDQQDDASRAKVEQQCQLWEAESCRKCADGVRDEFKFCYYDSKRLSNPDTVRGDCLAVHVGNKCEPCESIFALNFGGSLREVNCKEFFSSIEKRNKLCDGCIKPSTVLE